MAGLLLGACSGSDQASRPTVATRTVTTVVVATPFCAEAVAFDEFIDNHGRDLVVPTETEQYLVDAQAQLQRMADLASVDEVADDIAIILEAYVELGETLAAVGYDIFEVDNAAFESADGIDASLRLDSYLLDACGFDPLAGLPFEGEAPEVFSDDELIGLIEGDDDAAVVELLTAQFMVDFELAEAEAACLAENMDRDNVIAISSGADVTEEMASNFVATLEQCDIDPTAVGG